MTEAYTSLEIPRELVRQQKLARTRRMKRVLDTISLVIAAPIVLPVGLAISASVRIIDGAPVLFKQERTGLNSASFHVLKFRTMKSGDGRNHDSTRITGLGHFLRRTSLDELPQLWNVMRGDMSLVGPRPLYPEYLPFYTSEERLRHVMRPGITGLSQVSGRNNLRWTNRLAKDVEYVANSSVALDLKVLALTLKKMFVSSDVAAVARDTGEPLNVERSYPRDSKYALRRFNLLDVPLRVAWMNDSRIRRYMQIPFQAEHEATVKWYHRNKYDSNRDDFVIYEYATELPVAMLGLRSEPGSDSGELYIFVAPDCGGMGIGTRSMRLLLEWAKLSRYKSVTLTVEDSNRAAWLIYEKLGFTRGSDESGNRRTYEFMLTPERGV